MGYRSKCATLVRLVVRVYGNPATNHMTVGVKTVDSHESVHFRGGIDPRALHGLSAIRAAHRIDGVA